MRFACYLTATHWPERVSFTMWLYAYLFFSDQFELIIFQLRSSLCYTHIKPTDEKNKNNKTKQFDLIEFQLRDCFCCT